MTNLKLDTRRSEQRRSRGVTLVELTVAIAVMGLVFAAVVPLFRGIRNSWDARQGQAEMVQNGRVLMDHFQNQMAKAKQISLVTDHTQTNGFIQFKGNDDKTYRYDLSGNGYVEFGELGKLSDLAGPVSSLKFTCYDPADMSTPTTDVTWIRVVSLQATLTKSASLGQDRTWTTSAYLRSDRPASTGPVGHWRFDEKDGATAIDSSGWGNEGTLYNMASNARTVGILNKSLAFDGSNDYVAVPCVVRDSFTISFWMRTSRNAGTGTTTWPTGDGLVDAEVAGSGDDFGVAVCENRVGFGMGKPTGDVTIRSTTSVIDNKWHHVAATWNEATGQMLLYVDGSQQASGTGPTTSRIAPSAIRFGGSLPGTSGEYYQGRLDEVRIYGRVLDASAIGDLYAIGNMVLHLPFDETTGSTAYDNIGSNNGTLYNMKNSSWKSGIWTGALDFDGKDDYVSIPCLIRNDFTIAFWVKTVDIGPKFYEVSWWCGNGLVDGDVQGSAHDFGTAIQGNVFAFGVNNPDARCTIFGTTSINDDDWHHCTATRVNASGLMTVYVDGVGETSGLGPTGTRSDPTDLRIGQAATLNPSCETHFDGTIDDVRLYNRVLTAAQIDLLLE